MLPRHGQPGLRAQRGGRNALRRLRRRSRLALGGWGAVGAREPVPPSGRGAVPAALAGRDPPLPVPAGRGDGEARLPSRRDDAGRKPLARAHARCAGLLDGGRPLAERLRRRGRNGEDRGRADHHRGVGARRAELSPLALRRALPRSRLHDGGLPRGLPLLLPPPLSARHGRVGKAAAPQSAARPPAGARRGLRDEERLGAGRLFPTGPGVATRGRRPARVRLDGAAVSRSARRRAPRLPRARRDHRHDVLREDRGLWARRLGASSSGWPTTGSTVPWALSSTRSS